MKTSVIEVHEMLSVWNVDEVEKQMSEVPPATPVPKSSPDATTAAPAAKDKQQDKTHEATTSK